MTNMGILIRIKVDSAVAAILVAVDLAISSICSLAVVVADDAILMHRNVGTICNTP
ncbi:hypothetical protein D3C73_1543890 [compost metagenome]